MVNVILTGATGFLGSEFIRLYHSQFRIFAFYRHTPLPANYPNVTWIKVDLTQKSDFDSALKLIDNIPIHAIIHAGGASPNRAYQDGNFQATTLGTQLLIGFARQLGNPKIIYISSLSAAVEFNGPYKLSKLKAEDLIKTSQLNYVILRPTVIIGPGAVDFDRIVKMCQRSPIIPTIGSGATLVQPISSYDLCSIIAGSVNHNYFDKTIQPLAGAQNLTQKEFLCQISSHFQHQPLFIPLPISFCLFASTIINRLNPRFGLNPERIWLQLQSVQIDTNPVQKSLNIQLMNLRETLSYFFKHDPRYLPPQPKTQS